MSQSKLPLHHQNGRDTAARQGPCSNDCSGEASYPPAHELHLPHHQSNNGNRRSNPPKNQLQEDDITRQTHQLLMLRQQQEQLRFLEEQLRLASMQDTPSRSSPRMSQRGTSSRRSRSPRVAFCEDVFCYTNPRDYEEIVSSWYSVG